MLDIRLFYILFDKKMSSFTLVGTIYNYLNKSKSKVSLWDNMYIRLIILGFK